MKLDCAVPRIVCHLKKLTFAVAVSCLAASSASAEMLWEVHMHEDQRFETGQEKGYSSACREGHVISGSISLQEPYPATPTLFRAARGFDVFENNKGAAGRWDFSVANDGPPRSVKVTVSITCYTGDVVEYFYD